MQLKQLKQKLFDEWGERTTLYHSIDKLVATMKALDIMVAQKPGTYNLNSHSVNNSEIVMFMIYAMMLIDDAGYYTFTELNSSVYLFPFKYVVEKEALYQDSRFSLSNFGGELTISLNEQ